MADALTVKLEGVEDAIRAFGAMKRAVSREVKDVVNLAALNILTRARQVVPVRTGRLRASLRVSFFLGGLAAEVGTDVFYAPLVEFGGKPYLIPAWDAERKTYLAALSAALSKATSAA